MQDEPKLETVNTVITFVSYLFLCAVVHKHHVVFSRDLLKLFPVFPLILRLVKESVGEKEVLLNSSYFDKCADCCFFLNSLFLEDVFGFVQVCSTFCQTALTNFPH